MSTSKRLGKWLLYSLSLAPAVFMLGYYWFAYIPSQHEYYMNLRFRSLAMMGDHLRVKLDRLATSFKYATGLGEEAERSKYIAELVPDLTYPSDRCRTSKPGMVELGNPDDAVCFYSEKGRPAEAAPSRIFGTLTQDDLFEDVMVADRTGRVIYQRSASSPRISALGDLSKTASGAKAAPGEGTGVDADAVRTVHLDDSDFALLMQPVRTALGETVQICGLVRASRLAEEARHVPPQYLLLLFAPLLIVLLGSPLLKILLLTRTGRLSFHDMTLLALFTLIAVAVVTMGLVSARQHRLDDARAEQQLDGFAGAINQQIRYDVTRVYSALDRFDRELAGGAGTAGDQKDIGGANASGLPADGLDPFDFVFWASEDGCQVAKWTTAKTNTRRVNQSLQQSFQNVIGGRLWAMRDDPKKRFTLQTLVSETTSRLIVVMAIPSKAGGRAATCPERAGAPAVAAVPASRAEAGPKPSSSKIVAAGLVAQLRSLSLPLVPPGAGFAIFEPDGRVLFHAHSERNLHENLFEEIRSPEPFRDAVAMRAKYSDAAYYRGRKFQFHVEPVEGIAGIPWSIAVFQEIEPRQALIGHVWAETLTLFASLVALIGVGCFVVIVILRVCVGLSWRRQVDFFLARLWPGPARKPVFRRLAWELAAMALVSVAVVMYGSANAYLSTGWLLPYHVETRGTDNAYHSAWLLIFCFLMPLSAMVLTGWRLWKPEPASDGLPAAGQEQNTYFACLTLVLVLVGVVPTLGFWNIAEAHEVRVDLMSWQQSLVHDLEARRSQIRANIESSRALSEEAKRYFLPKAEKESERDERNYVSHFWETKLGSSAERQAEPCRWDAAGGIHLTVTCVSSSGPAVTVESTLPPIGISIQPAWLVLALVLLGAAYGWNCLAFGRLFLLRFRYNPLPLLNDLPAASEVKAHLMVLGLPLARKDKAVQRWLGYEAPRVNLHTAQFSKGWIGKQTALLKEQLRVEPAAQAAAVGGTAQAAPGAPAMPWIHISNLEAKLSEAADRKVTADLIEELILMDVGDARVRLVVTSAVDPVFHFDSVLSDERRKIYEHPLPEPELQRLARLLYNFRKVQSSPPDPMPPAWALSAEGQFIFEECRHQQALREVGEEVAGAAPAGAPQELLLAMIAERALALYKLYWSSCTRSEKLLLIQLAQTGFVNPMCLDTLEALIRKGLILPDRRPTVMNETFRRFLERVEAPDRVRQWESEAGESSWLIIRNIVLVLIVVGLGVVGVTQIQVMQTATAVLTGVVTMMAAFSRLLGYLTGRRTEAPAGPA